MADDPITPTTPAVGAVTDDTHATPTGPDLAAELAQWKADARKHEERAKQGAKAIARLAEIEESAKSELEKATAAAAAADERAKQADERATRALIKAAVSVAAVNAGAVDADAVFALLPSDTVTVEGEDVRGVDEALAALRASKPFLFGKTKPAPGSADGGRQSDKPSQWTKEDLKGKSPEQINAARKAGLLASLLTESTP